jgi:hypothetical protein
VDFPDRSAGRRRIEQKNEDLEKFAAAQLFFYHCLPLSWVSTRTIAPRKNSTQHRGEKGNSGLRLSCSVLESMH